jgi:hypothetical protein
MSSIDLVSRLYRGNVKEGEKIKRPDAMSLLGHSYIPFPSGVSVGLDKIIQAKTVS